MWLNDWYMYLESRQTKRHLHFLTSWLKLNLRYTLKRCVTEDVFIGKNKMIKSMKETHRVLSILRFGKMFMFTFAVKIITFKWTTGKKHHYIRTFCELSVLKYKVTALPSPLYVVRVFHITSAKHVLQTLFWTRTDLEWTLLFLLTNKHYCFSFKNTNEIWRWYYE